MEPTIATTTRGTVTRHATHPGQSADASVRRLRQAWTRTRLVTGRQLARAVGRTRPGDAEAVEPVTEPTPGPASERAFESATGPATGTASGPAPEPANGPASGANPEATCGPTCGDGERGMATAEYAIATVAAAGFAGLLVVILRSGEVRELLLGIIRSALSL
jgi:hypothetical protein